MEGSTASTYIIAWSLTRRSAQSRRDPCILMRVPLPLSISIVCCSNEGTLPRVLDSIRGLAEEVVAFDSGSTDGTLPLLRSHGVRVVEQPWLGFVQQKQAAFEACTRPWVLHLDSDESLEPSLRASIERVFSGGGPPDRAAGYEVNRKVWYAGRFLEHAWQPEWRLRLVRRDRARWGGYDPHDAMEILPAAAPADAVGVERLAGDLRHDSITTISEFLEKQARHARAAALSQYGRGRRGSAARLALSPAGEFLKQVMVRGAWRDGWRGWVAASASSAAILMKHAALVELSHRGGGGGRE